MKNRLRMTHLLLIVAALLAQPIAYAYDRNDLERLLTTHSCEFCDLSDIALWGRNLAGAKLRGADLRGAAIGKTDFTNADLTETRLNGAVFFMSHFEKTLLRNADRSRAGFFLCSGY